LTIPTKQDLAKKKVEEEKQKLLELERQRHENEVKRLQKQQQEELARQRLSTELEKYGPYLPPPPLSSLPILSSQLIQ